MEVILLSDVKGIGKKGETKSVSDGYATNFLIPKKLAVRKTAESVKVLERQNEQKRLEEEHKKEIALKNKEELEKITLEFKARKQAKGQMAGSISTKEVENKLKEQYGITIDKRKFVEKYPINAFGYTNLKIELYKGVIGVIRVHVTEEE